MPKIFILALNMPISYLIMYITPVIIYKYSELYTKVTISYYKTLNCSNFVINGECRGRANSSANDNKNRHSYSNNHGNIVPHSNHPESEGLSRIIHKYVFLVKI